MLLLLLQFVIASQAIGPSSRTVYYLHTTSAKWLAASDTCAGYDGHLLMADNVSNLVADIETLDKHLDWKYAFKNLTQDVWIGLYKYNRSGQLDVMWHKCQNVTNRTDIVTQLMDNGEYCVKMTKNYELEPYSCNTPLPYICQMNEGQCWFLPFENKQFSIEANETETGNVNDCAKKCRNLTKGNSECWGFRVELSNATCYFYLTSERHAYIRNSGQYIADTTDGTVYLKVCVGGDTTPMKPITNRAGNPSTENCTNFKSGESWLDVCYCDCDQPPIILSPEYLILTPEEKIEKIINELLIDASNTSASFRKLNSIDDKRPSARSIGSMGIIIICLVFGGILLLDLNLLIANVTSFFCQDKKGKSQNANYEKERN